MEEFLLENDSELSKLLEENLQFTPTSENLENIPVFRAVNPAKEILLDAISYNEERLRGFHRMRKEKCRMSQFGWFTFLSFIISLAILRTGYSVSTISVCHLILIIFVHLSFTQDQRKLERLQVLLENVKELDNLFSKAKRYIQEIEVVSRGYRLGSKLPPLERLEASIKSRSALDLRVRLIEACNMFLDTPLASEDGLSIEAMKNAFRMIRVNRIQQYYTWIDMCEGTALPVQILEEIYNAEILVKGAKRLVTQGLENLTSKFCAVDLKFPSAQAEMHYKIHQMHASALLFVDSVQTRESRKLYLSSLCDEISELKNLCSEQLRCFSSAESSDPSGNCIQVMPVAPLSPAIANEVAINIKCINWTTEQPSLLAEAEVFEGDCFKSSTLKNRSKVPREQRILNSRLESDENTQWKQLKRSEFEMLSELGKVLRARSQTSS